MIIFLQSFVKKMLVPISVLVFNGCYTEQVTHNVHSGNQIDNKCSENLSCDNQLFFSGQLNGNILDITASNVGDSNIVIDKNLVFFVHLTAYDDKKQMICFSPIDIVNSPSNNRDYVLLPGKKINRRIDFNKNFIDLSFATSAILDTPTRQVSIEAFEQSLALPPDVVIDKVVLEYGMDADDKWLVPYYLGCKPDSLIFYTKPCSITIQQSKQKK
jgi:hypothetical protein